MSKFENNITHYIKDSIADFDENKNHFYIAEKPKVHIRNGDATDIYDEILKEYTELLNRLSGLADEMGSFFNRLKKLETTVLQETKTDNANITKNEVKEIKHLNLINKSIKKETTNKIETLYTPYDCLRSVLNK